MITSLPGFIRQCSLGAQLQRCRPFPAQRPSEAPPVFLNKVWLTGTSQLSLIGLHPFLPALLPTILPLMLQSNSLFSVKNTGEMDCPSVAGLSPEWERPSPPHAFYPTSETQRGRRCDISDVQNPQLKAWS